MLNVQRYLRTEGNSLESLTDQLGIVVRDYPDIVVLNYNQIDSPRFHPICDECRGLILEKGTWDIVARSFQRFYNLGEGHDKGLGFMRLPSYRQIADENGKLVHPTIPFDLTHATAVEKLDGSLITAYFRDNKWNFSTRGMAYAEGETNFGMSFNELINTANNHKNVMAMLSEFVTVNNGHKLCWVFELTSPANRIVTPYSDTRLNLIAVVHKETGIEFSQSAIFDIGTSHGIAVPYTIETNSWEDLVKAVEDMPSMDEGVVVVLDDGNCSAPLRIKVKNPKFVAIAHMRENGQLSPKSVLKLVMENETEEYLGYFECDKPFFDVANRVFNEFVSHVNDVWDESKDIEAQKEFALYIQSKTKYPMANGVLFKCRKLGITVEECVHDIQPDKLVKSLNLDQLLASVCISRHAND